MSEEMDDQVEKPTTKYVAPQDENDLQTVVTMPTFTTFSSELPPVVTTNASLEFTKTLLFTSTVTTETPKFFVTVILGNNTFDPTINEVQQVIDLTSSNRGVATKKK
jgi:hypothetical protein